MKRRGLFSVLNNRGFSVFCGSQTVSQFGDKLDHIALIALLSVLGRSSPSAFAQLAFFFTLPVLLFGPISGALVDRWSRKKVMITCDCLRGFLVSLIPVVALLAGGLWSVYGVVFLVFFFALFFNNAKMSMIPNLVSKDELLAANSINTLIGRVATVLAFLVGDFIVYWKGWSRAGISGWQAGFYIDGLTFFISACALGAIKVSFKRPSDSRVVERGGQPFPAVFLRTFRDVREGMKLVLAEKRVMFVMASVVVLTFVGGSVYVLAVPLIKQELQRGAFSVGTLGAVLAVGMVIGSFLFGNLGHRLRMSTVMMGGFVFLGAMMCVFSALRSFAATCLTIVVSGVALAPIMICQDTLLHQVLAEETRGRVFGTKELTLNGLFMLSAIVMGSIAGVLSTRVALRVAGMLVVLVGLAAFAARRSMIGDRA